MSPTAALFARNQRILAGHAAGATILDLALAEEVDPAVVRRVLHAAGIPMRENGFYSKPQDRITPEVADRIVSLYLAGSSAERVADELGLPVKAVNRLFEERTLSA